MAAHPGNSMIIGDLYATPQMRAVFDDRRRLQYMLDVEAALARVQARLGLIPAEAAAAITGAARADRLDMDTIRRSTAVVGYPVVGLTKALAAAAGREAGRWVHWGATTQDILDTATMLQVREALALLDADLVRTLRGLAALADRHRDTVMAGRTHLQHALPITFGYKCALWMQPLLRALQGLRAEVPILQFGGAVGTLAALGDAGPAAVDALAAELGLAPPPAPWHVDRSVLTELVCRLGVLCGALAKMAADVALLMQSEVAELREPHRPGRGGSSTMPQKRNPIACEYIIAATRGVQALAPLMLGAMIQDHERSTGPWQSEALALPQAFLLTAAALSHAATLAEGLEVDGARMAANLAEGGGLIMAEAAMMLLAARLGRDAAHHHVQEACDRALATGRPLREALLDDAAVIAVCTPAELAARLEPAAHLGQAGAIVDATVARCARLCTAPNA